MNPTDERHRKWRINWQHIKDGHFVEAAVGVGSYCCFSCEWLQFWQRACSKRDVSWCSRRLSCGWPKQRKYDLSSVLIGDDLMCRNKLNINWNCNTYPLIAFITFHNYLFECVIARFFYKTVTKNLPLQRHKSCQSKWITNTATFYII